MTNVLFIVENDYFPRDARVYNEANTLCENGDDVFVLAPRNFKKKEKFFEKVEGKFLCFRHPHFESNSTTGLLFEYILASAFYLIFVPFLVFINKIKIIHVANPPDFVLPSFFWLKIFGVKFIFDIHDLSVETFRAKTNSDSWIAKIIIKVLELMENLSIELSDAVITTNNSIKEIVKNKNFKKQVFIVRNANKIQFKSIRDVRKEQNHKLLLGYFGIISDDEASGLMNLVKLGEYLVGKGVDFYFEIIGNGSGIERLKNSVKKLGLENRYIFRGFIEFANAINYIKQFDFGILPWPNIPKNNLHTSMKLMDYMCCGVPVCTLKLKEQVITTNEIGIHTNSFADMSLEIIRVFNNRDEYEKLRENTLNYFNKNLCWERQEYELLNCYNNLLK